MFRPSDLKQQIRRAFRSIGFDISRYRFERTDAGMLNSTLHSFGIDLIVDVGANTGQYAMGARSGGYKNRLVSFEPLTEAHALLTANSSKDALWDVYARCAVGNQDGEIEINISGNSVSSSILPMLAAHSDAAPESNYVSAERTKIIRLDSVFGSLLRGEQNIFLKIDTQGFEYEVLQGASDSLEKIKAIQLELSLVPLYKGQRLWNFLIEHLTRKGFSVWSFIPVFADTRTGRLLQMDAILYRA